IRDFHVTGVQTCALPILSESKALASIEDLERLWFEMQREMTESGRITRFSTKVINLEGQEQDTPVVRLGGFTASSEEGFLTYLRSEERRVGKECRSWVVT